MIKKGNLHTKWASGPLARHSLAFREIWVMDQCDAGATMFVSRPGIAALVISMAVLAINGGAQSSETAITCANPASGASWQIKIDYDRRTVDSNPARFSDAEISWHDRTDGGNYTLDRKSGNLTVIVASSTGGYFLNDRCRLEN
jgi:hypothetical protein